ncbi:MAG: AMP-binding protein [Desulfobacterales bacterium]
MDGLPDITPETTFNDVVAYKANTVGDKVYLTYVRDFDNNVDETYTYRDMHRLSNRLANGLLKLGIKKGDGISLMEINSPEFLFTVFAAFKIGVYVVLVNTGLKGEGLQYIIDHSDSKALLIHWSFLDQYADIRDRLPKLEHIIVDTSEAPEGFALPENAVALKDIMAAPDTEVRADIEPDDMAVLIYTSGTTGLPKATTFQHGRISMGPGIMLFLGLAQMMAKPDDVLYTCLPLFHGNALQLTALPGFFAEIPVVLSKRFSASRFWDIIRKYGVTNFNLLGSMPQFLLKQPEKENDRDNRVWRVNTAACPRELIVKFENRFGVKVYEGYGAVDGGGFMLKTFGLEDVPVGTMGKADPGVTAEVMGEDGRILPPGEVGELVFLVPEEELESRKVVYYKDERSSAERIREDASGRKWFHTGDLATRDENGWFFFVDRKKDAIRRRGENIAAWSIERVINQHEKVLESAAYGVKSEEYAEDEIMATVVLKPGEVLKPEELLAFCRNKMADFMLPRYVEFVDKLPKSEVHRIMKRFLKERGVTPATWDREKNG